MSWLQQLIRPGARGKTEQVAKKLYEQVMAAARSPVLYEKGWLPDTMDGRFHSVCLHASLVIPRLERAGETGTKLSAAFNDALFDSFDAALRETGVGDASIARRIRKMGETFVGVGRAVAASVQTDDALIGLTDVLVRNEITGPDTAPAFADYLLERDNSLSQLQQNELLAGNLPW